MLKDKLEVIKEFWKEYKKVKYGIIGFVFIVICLLLVVFESVISPFPQAGKNWRNIEYWENNPKSARPIWVNYISKKKYPKSEQLEDPVINEIESKRSVVREIEYTYSNIYDYTLDDIVLEYELTGTVIVFFSIKRPDGKEINMIKKVYKTDNIEQHRISIASESKQEVYNFIRKNSNDSLEIDREIIDPIQIIFTDNYENGNISKGDYKLKAKIVLMKDSGKINNFSVRAKGKVYGIMGTDSFKRDIFSGLIAGMKWALFIGFMVSLVTVSFGVVYGITSAYFGGMTDSVMQRIYEYFVNIPFLPILIVMSAVFKPSIWTFIGLMCVLGWTGSVRTVRSMGLQIREETFVEASKALGASGFRIIFSHMIPLVIPYSFATMALAVPAAILSEAGISILGLGDSTIVTWGQMLQDAKTSGAVIQGMWWWILPPGIMITLVGMSFAFIGFSMDKILMPKLKTR